MRLTRKRGISKRASGTAEATNNELPRVRGQAGRARLSLLLSTVVCLMALRNIIKALSLHKGSTLKLVAFNDSSFSFVLELPSSSMNQSVATQSQPPTVQNATLASMKIGLYMTTHQSAEHMAFLRRCWPHATQKLRLLQHSHLLYYTSAPTDNDVPHDILSRLVFQNVTVFRYSEAPLRPDARHPEKRARKQLGAKRAMVDPILKHWFDDYDWIIRLNPDVLIRNDTWLIEQMLNPSVHAILYGFDHNGSPNSALHSDFYAFRPHALTSQPHIAEKFLEEHLANNEMTAEEQMLALFAKLLENEAQAGNQTGGAAANSGRVAWLPGVERLGSQARMLGLNSPVLHVHHLVNYCPDYFKATDGQTF
jgi:hypothetical protein